MSLRKTTRNIYLYCIILNLLLLMICNLVESDVAQLIFEFSGFLSLLILIRAIKKENLWITPVNIFILVWMILIPTTSGACPLMDKMSIIQINICLISDVFFCLGGLFGVKVNVNSHQRKDKTNLDLGISRIIYQICIFLILISLAIFIILIRVNGIPFFSSDTNAARRTFYSIPLSSFLHMLGIPAVYIIFSDSKFRKKKSFILLFILYTISLLLLGVRFVLALEFLMILSVLEENIYKRLNVKKVVGLLILGVVVFYLITSIRGGTNDKQQFFVNTGLYSGSAKDLVKTEIVRYFGMSQRVMEQYIRTYTPGCTKGLYTFFPLFKNIYTPENTIRNGISIYGYTATNVISYLWMDFGYFGFLFWLLWSVMYNVIFFYYEQHNRSLVIRYLWAITVFSLFMSFYCYVNSYAYWCFEYPIMILIIQDINSKLVK